MPLMNEKIYNVLFLCTGNSARSILAEGLLNSMSRGRFEAYSAGSKPLGRVNPLAIETLENAGIETGYMRSKSWDEFSAVAAPHMDFIFTVCDNAAGEACPVRLGHPVSAHWSYPDPSQVAGDEEANRAAFAQTARDIASRILLFLSLPLASLDRMALQARLRDLSDEIARNLPPWE